MGGCSRAQTASRQTCRRAHVSKIDNFRSTVPLLWRFGPELGRGCIVLKGTPVRRPLLSRVASECFVTKGSSKPLYSKMCTRTRPDAISGRGHVHRLGRQDGVHIRVPSTCAARDSFVTFALFQCPHSGLRLQRHLFLFCKHGAEWLWHSTGVGLPWLLCECTPPPPLPPLLRTTSLKVDESFRTSNPRVFAVGDVIGPPGLASSAQMGGRAVASALFSDKMERLKQFMLETSTEIEVSFAHNYYCRLVLESYERMLVVLLRTVYSRLP